MNPQDWPVVHELDDGIRPAGPPDACLYCGQKVSSPHSKDCVMVTKRILVSVQISRRNGRRQVGARLALLFRSWHGRGLCTTTTRGAPTTSFPRMVSPGIRRMLPST